MTAFDYFTNANSLKQYRNKVLYQSFCNALGFTSCSSDDKYIAPEYKNQIEPEANNAVESQVELY